MTATLTDIGGYQATRQDRDQTLRHHGFLSENRFEAVGQVYLGVDPEFPMVAF